jgi:hypothetical protein
MRSISLLLLFVLGCGSPQATKLQSDAPDPTAIPDYRLLSASIPNFVPSEQIDIYDSEKQAFDAATVKARQDNGRILVESRDQDELLRQYRALAGNEAANPDWIRRDDGLIQADVTSFLPERARSVYGYQTILHGPNCYGTALYTKGILPVPRYLDYFEVDALLQSCQKLPRGATMQKGDLVYFKRKTLSTGRWGQSWAMAPVHMAYVLSEGGRWLLQKTGPDRRTRPVMIDAQQVYERIFPTPEACRGLDGEPDNQRIECRLADTGQDTFAWTEIYRCSDNLLLPSRTEALQSNEAKTMGAALDQLERTVFAMTQGELYRSEEQMRADSTGMNSLYAAVERTGQQSDIDLLRGRWASIRNAVTMVSLSETGYDRTIEAQLPIVVDGSRATLTLQSPQTSRFRGGPVLWAEYRFFGDTQWTPVPLSAPRTASFVWENLAPGNYDVQVRFRDTTGGGSLISPWNRFVIP